MSEGPILWIYSAESCNDVQFGLAVFGQFFNLAIVTMVTEYIVAWIKPEGFFYLLAVTNFLGGVFCKVFVKETSGLSAAEKKMQYKKE